MSEGVGAMVFQQENKIYVKEAQDTIPRPKNKVGIQYIDYLSKMNIFEKSGDRRDTLPIWPKAIHAMPTVSKTRTLKSQPSPILREPHEEEQRKRSNKQSSVILV